MDLNSKLRNESGRRDKGIRKRFWWRKQYGGMKVDHAKRLKALEAENARLKRAVADLSVDKLILKEVAEGKY